MAESTTSPAKKSSAAQTMRRVQQLHLILGTLFAPLILFFSLSGALQTLGLHEQEKAGGHTPAWMAQLASVHKNQQLSRGEGRPPKSEGASDAAPKKSPSAALKDEGNGARGPSPWPLKWFVVLMSMGLAFTTELGVWMAFKYSKNKAMVWALLAVGTLLPLVLLWL